MRCATNLPRYDVDATRLFSESCTRFLVEVEPARAKDFERCFEGLDCARVGEVKADPRLVIRGISGRVLVDQPLDALRAAHHGGFNG
jgi:phosphoribosylformylglycinamidine synthase